MPQDREEEMRRLNRTRDDVAYGAGGLGAGEGRSFGAERPGRDGRDAVLPPSTEASANAGGPVEVATGDRHDSYLEADDGQGVRARFTQGACGPSQNLQGEPDSNQQSIENATVMPDAPSVWDARPRR